MCRLLVAIVDKLASTPTEKTEIKINKNKMANLDGVKGQAMLSPAGRETENRWYKV